MSFSTMFCPSIASLQQLEDENEKYAEELQGIIADLRKRRDAFLAQNRLATTPSSESKQSLLNTQNPLVNVNIKQFYNPVIESLQATLNQYKQDSKAFTRTKGSILNVAGANVDRLGLDEPLVNIKRYLVTLSRNERRALAFVSLLSLPVLPAVALIYGAILYKVASNPLNKKVDKDLAEVRVKFWSVAKAKLPIHPQIEPAPVAPSTNSSNSLNASFSRRSI